MTSVTERIECKEHWWNVIVYGECPKHTPEYEKQQRELRKRQWELWNRV